LIRKERFTTITCYLNSLKNGILKNPAGREVLPEQEMLLLETNFKETSEDGEQ